MKLLGFLLLLGVVILYWKWILLAVIVIAAVRAFPQAWREHREEQAVRAYVAAELAWHADAENALVMIGDERGVYGAFPPAC